MMRGRVVFRAVALVVLTAVLCWGCATIPNLHGRWQINQGNGEYQGLLTLQQNGNSLAGEMIWDNHRPAQVTGIIYGDSIRMEFVYSGDLIGTYRAKLSADRARMLDGVTKANTGNSSTWHASRVK